MEVKAGYKQTDSGIIPNDWECRKLNELAGYVNGKAQEGSIKDSGKYVVVNSKFIASDGEVKKYSDVCLCEAKVGDVLMVLSDVPNGRAIAKCFLVNEKDKYSVNQRICLLSPRGIDGRLLFYKLNRNPHFISFDDGVKQTNLRKQDVLNCPIGFPQSQAEQQAIANALSDADALIESLEQLIEKKRQIKQGVMQELLTGKRRLPGFSGEWEVRQLESIADVKTGPFGSALHESDYAREGTPIITVEHLGEFGVEHTNLPLVSDFDRQRLKAYSLEKGDIVFSRVGSVDRNALIRQEEDGWLFSGRLLRVRPDKRQIFAPFLSYQFRGAMFLSKVRSVAVGQTMACLNTQILNGIPVLIPKVPEQTAIGEVLTGIDDELEVLELRLKKASTIKQAMMQELLTGKVRLV